jgi:hypothetical protein
MPFDPSSIQNRIVEYRRVKASDLTANTGNWRTHGDEQRGVLTGVLKEIGQVGAVLAYYSERNGGALTLLDGHLRKDIDPSIEWPTLVTDLSDAEADYILTLYDNVTQMAGVDGAKLSALTERIRSDDIAVRDLLTKLEDDAARALQQIDQDARDEERPGPPAMELLPYENYDYIVLMFKNELDWAAAVETLGLERKSDPRKTPKVGLARVVDGIQVVERLRGRQ